MRYYKKIESRQALLLSNGAWFKFEPCGDYGILATDDNFLITELQKAMAGQRGGVTEINLIEYQDLKKNPKSTLRNGPEKISPQLLRQFAALKKNVGRAVGNMLEVGDEVFKNITEPMQTSEYRPGSVKR